MSTIIASQLAVDPALVMDANYKFNSSDRRYIDDQIRAIEQLLVDNLINGKHGSWFTLSGASVAVVAGDVVCLSGVPGLVTKAVSSPLSTARSAVGVVVQAASPGGKVLVAISGVISPSFTGLAASLSGYVRVDTTTARCERVAMVSDGDYIIGTVDLAGWMHIMPASKVVQATGTPTGTGIPHIVVGVQDAAASLIVNADVDAAAAIAASKVVQATGSGSPHVTAGVLDAAALASRKELKICTLEDFGAVGDGVTNDNAALVAAFAAVSAGTYRTLLLGAKTYLVTGAAVPANCNVIGVGDASILKTGTDAAILTLDGAEDVTLANFYMQGDQVGSSQFGIACGSLTAGQARVRIDNVEGHTLYHCFHFQLNNGGADGPIVSNCRARGAYGFYVADGSEWVTFSNCHAYQCSRGLYIGSGNISWTGGTLNYNTYGVYLATGSNDSHGIVNGTHIDHNTTSVYSAAITNGFTFIGCNIYQGNIELVTNTGSVDFVGCVVDVEAFIFTNSLAKFSDCRIDTAYFVSYTDTGTADTEWRNCRKLDGSVPAYIGDRTHPLYTFPSDANQTLSAQLSRAESIDIQAGVVSATRTLTLARAPNKGAEILVVNRTLQQVDVKWSSGTAASVTSGNVAIIGADGTNAVRRMLSPV